MQGLGKPGVNQAKMIEWGLFRQAGPVRQPKPLRVPYLRKAYTGGHPDETNHPSFIPKTYVPRPSSKANATGGAASPKRPIAKISSSTTSTRRMAAPRSTCLDGLAVVDHLLEFGNDYVRAMRHPTSNSCSPSIHGWRTTA